MYQAKHLHLDNQDAKEAFHFRVSDVFLDFKTSSDTDASSGSVSDAKSENKKE